MFNNSYLTQFAGIRSAVNGTIVWYLIWLVWYLESIVFSYTYSEYVTVAYKVLIFQTSGSVMSACRTITATNAFV